MKRGGLRTVVGSPWVTFLLALAAAGLFFAYADREGYWWGLDRNRAVFVVAILGFIALLSFAGALAGNVAPELLNPLTWPALIGQAAAWGIVVLAISAALLIMEEAPGIVQVVLMLLFIAVAAQVRHLIWKRKEVRLAPRVCHGEISPVLYIIFVLLGFCVLGVALFFLTGYLLR